MKRLLCYGDSITWGCNPETGKRFDAQTMSTTTSMAEPICTHVWNLTSRWI